MSRGKKSFKDDHPVAHGMVYSIIPAALGLAAGAIPAVMTAKQLKWQKEQAQQQEERLEKQYMRADKAAVRSYDENLRGPILAKMAELRRKYGYDWVEDVDATDELAAFVIDLKQQS